MQSSTVAAAIRAALVISTTLPATMTPAWASDPATADTTSGATSQPTTPPDELQDVIVTGYARSLQQAIEMKRLADVVSDGISAEDIGKFPEQNLAESLQRITGVQITRNLGDGQFISVRGLDPKFTNTLYNGRELPSGSGSRAFDYQVLSGSFANQVDVYKSPTADMLESGLAATVNTQSIRPLDYGKQKLSLTADGIYDNQAKQGLEPHLAALYTNVFAEDRLGWMIGVDYNKRRLDDQSFGTDGVISTISPYQGVETTSSRIFGLRARDQQGTDERISGVSMLQFKLNDAVELRLDTLVSRFKQKYYAYLGYNMYPGAGALGESPTDSMTLNPQNVATAWAGSNVFGYVETDYAEYVQDLNSTALGGTFKVADWTINAEGSFGKSVERATNFYLDWGAAAGHGANLSYDTNVDRGGPPSISFYGGYDPNDPANYQLLGLQGDFRQPTSDRIFGFKLDAERPLDLGWLHALKIGAEYQDRVLASSPNYIATTTNGLPSDLNSYLFQYRNPAFFSGYSGPASFPKTWIDPDLPRFFKDYPISSFVAANTPKATLTSTTRVQEKSEAAYGQIAFQSSDERLKGNLGLRVVRTEEISSGFFPTADAFLVYGAGQLTFSDASLGTITNTYNDFLPSLNLSYKMADDFIARFAVARVMQRPDMNLLAAASNTSAANQPPPPGTPWIGTLSEGNPNLMPFRSNQLDLSLEWYFSERSLLSADVFLKDVKNLVLTNYSQETQNVTLQAVFPGSPYQVGDQVPINLDVARPVNSPSTLLKGVELAYQQPFTFLPWIFRGLGVQANYTHIWAGSVVQAEGKPAVPLTGVSKDSFNAGLYFQNSHFEAHALYNYRSAWVADPISYFGDGDFVKAYGQLDLSASYSITNYLSVNGGVTNLTNNALVHVNQYDIARLYDLSGTRYTLGLRLVL